MSQVIVTEDNHDAARKRTRAQELKIDREGEFKKWHKSDVTRVWLIERLLAPVVVPVGLMWGIIMATMGYSLLIFTYGFKLLGKIFGRRS